MVNRHAVIIIASIIVIGGSVGYSSLSLVSAKDLQVRWYQIDSFDLLSIMFGGKLSICNNSALPASFASYSFDVIYEEKSLGKFSIEGATLAPHTSTMVGGKFTTDDKRVVNILFASLDTALSGSGQAARINPEHMEVVSTLETRIIGLVPFSITQKYAGPEFVQMMNERTSCDK